MRTAYRFTKRKSKPYYYVTFAHIPDRWFSTGATTMEGAIDFARKFMEKGNAKDTEITLREFAHDFFTESDPHGYRHRLLRRDTLYQPSYFEQHQGRLDNHILPAHGNYLLSSLTETLIEDFILDIPKVANSTKNKILTCYRILLHEAVREGYIKDNPADKVKELPPNYTRRDVFTSDEIALMFPDDDEDVVRFWGSLMWAVYFAVLKDTGWRPSEVAGLSKMNWFPELRGIYTTDSVDYRTGNLKSGIKTTRKGQPFKDGFLSAQTARLLVQLVNMTHDEYLFKVREHGGSGKFITPDTANKHLRLRCAQHNIVVGDRTQYCFRHTFNTASLGTLPETARLILMGHTANRQEYNHLTPRQALERVLSIEGVKEALDIETTKK